MPDDNAPATRTDLAVIVDVLERLTAVTEGPDQRLAAVTEGFEQRLTAVTEGLEQHFAAMLRAEVSKLAERLEQETLNLAHRLERAETTPLSGFYKFGTEQCDRMRLEIEHRNLESFHTDRLDDLAGRVEAIEKKLGLPPHGGRTL